MVSSKRGGWSLGGLSGRKHMGAGEFLSRGASPYVFQVDSPNEKPHWRPRDPGDQTRPAFVGTAIVIDGEIYEVADHGVSDSGEGRHLYRLSPWDDREPIRGDAFEYSLESVRQERAAQAASIQQHRMGATLDWLGVLVALLPAKEQQRLFQRYAFDGVFWTKWSALVWTVLWFGLGIVTLAHYFPSPGSVFTLLLAGAMLIEQFYRRAEAISGRPCGSLLGRLLMPIVRRLDRDPKGT